MTLNDPGVDTNDAKTLANQERPQANQGVPPMHKRRVLIIKVNWRLIVMLSKAKLTWIRIDYVGLWKDLTWINTD